MRRIFPSILSPASSGSSPHKEDDFSQGSVSSTQDKECVVTAPAPSSRHKSPSRARSPFRWGRSSTRDEPTKREPKNNRKDGIIPHSGESNSAFLAARRMSHPGRSADLDYPVSSSRSAATGFEDDCVEKQVLTVRDNSPTSYFQSAHRLRASMDSEGKSSTTTTSYDLVVSPQRIYPDESLNRKAKRHNSAPKLRIPFSGDQPKPLTPHKSTTQLEKRSSSTTRGSRGEPTTGTFTAFANMVTNWQSPGRTRHDQQQHTRSNSRGSSDGLSVASNSASNSFRDPGEKTTTPDDNVPYKFRRDSNNERQVKYKSARSVAEKLSKALRGSSKASPPNKSSLPSIPDTIRHIVKSSPNKDSTRALQSYFNEEVDEYEVPSEIVMEFPSSRDPSYISYGTSELKSFRNESRTKEFFPIDKRRQLEEQEELEQLDSQLKDYSENFQNMYDRAEERAKEAEDKLAAVRAEVENFDMDLPDIDEDWELDEVSSNPHRKVKELLEHRLLLAREAASEAKLCVMDHIAVKEGWGLMQRRLAIAAATSNTEKREMQAALEDELQRREAEWIARLEKIQMEETRLKNRVRDIAENNVGLQKEMASMASREKTLREQIRHHEQQHILHKKKLAEAEKVVLEIRESSVANRKQNMHTEDELNSLRKAYHEKEEENADLKLLVSRLQQLCTDHEKSISGLWSGLKSATESKSQEREKAVNRVRNELLRLSTIEQGLRRDLDASNREGAAIRRELKTVMEKLEAGEKSSVPEADAKEIDLKTKMYELQEHNAVLSIKLNTSLREEKIKADAVRELEERNKALQGEKDELQDDIAQRKAQFEEKEKDCKWLETRLQAVAKTNRLLQGMVAKQAALRSKGSDVPMEEANDMQSEIQKCMEVSGEQLTQLNERIELMNDKLLERESELFAAKADCAKKDVTVQGLEQNLTDTKKTLEGRIQRLTGRNEELFRLYNAKEKELADFQSRLKNESELRKRRELELEQCKEQVGELQEELKVQGMHCTLLREKLCSREVELENQDVETKKSVEDRDVLEKDTKKLQELLEDARQRMIGLEHKLAEKENTVVWLQGSLNDNLQSMSKAKDELARTKRDRDLMSREAEELGREALRASAEVEVLRRRVNRLEEDIMLKDGELSILQNNLDD